MGVVYSAHDERLGRTVALKTLRAELADGEARERLRREARTAASISHPNVCQLYEIGEANGELFIAMELLSGEALSTRLASGALPVAEAVEITHDVLAALSALHQRGIVHRDLKPSNIFVTEHGAKLLDFGVAHSHDEVQRTMMPLTGPGTILGTPRYMAPEHASGEPVDARSDLFSRGRGSLRDALRTPGLRRRHRRSHSALGDVRAAAGPHRVSYRHRARSRHSTRHDETAGGALRLGREDGRGSARRLQRIRNARSRARTTDVAAHRAALPPAEAGR